MLNDDQKEMYERWGAAPPSHEPHGTPEEIVANMMNLKPTKWRQEGNQLIGDTEMGELVHFIPTHKMLVGTDKDGLPILKDMIL